MRTLNVAWFVDDAADPEEASRDLTPYNLLASAAISATRDPNDAMLRIVTLLKKALDEAIILDWQAMIDVALSETVRSE
jgi:hypothetical protein